MVNAKSRSPKSLVTLGYRMIDTVAIAGVLVGLRLDLIRGTTQLGAETALKAAWKQQTKVAEEAVKKVVKAQQEAYLREARPQRRQGP